VSYLFFLGRSHELAFQELSVFFPTSSQISDTIVEVSDDSFTHNKKELPIKDALSVLGGTVKIAQILGSETTLSPLDIAKYILKESDGKLTFGMSSYEGVPKVSERTNREIKEILEKGGRKARFILPKEHAILSGVAVSKQDVLEINIAAHDGAFLITKTVALQEFEEWAIRDFERPFYDSKKGMLPPKAARMAVNIGLGADAQGKTLLDPFCGMGTIPSEALLEGAIVMGSDSDKDAVEKAKKNDIWLRSYHTTLPPITYFVSDATHVSQQIRKETIDVIVTEPFMGSPKLGEGKITDPKEIKNSIRGLEKLYIGCLKDWQKILKPKGVVVIAIPQIVLANTKYSVKTVIDSCETLGYTNLLGPLPYSRPQAVVRRMFYKFVKL
jgi:tRNA G10  N-methylase Trm11